MQNHFDTMDKRALRAACKEARVKNYAHMNVATMRAALAALLPTAPLETVFTGAGVPDSTPPATVPVAPTEPTPTPEPALETAAPVVKATREVRNGVKRPRDPNGKCGQVWAALDELVANGEADLTKAIHAIGEERGWNRSNTSQELSAFKRYTGIGTSRAKTP